MLRGRGRRGRNVSRRVPKVSKEERHKLSATITRYVPPLDPPERADSLQWVRVVQMTQALVQSTTDAKVGIWQPYPLALFEGGFSTTGFDGFFLHRVSVWSGMVIPGSGRTVFPTVRISHQFNKQVVEPRFTFRAPGYNLRAHGGYHVPNHISGPYRKDLQESFITVEAWNGDDAQAGTFEVQSIIAEFYVTFY